MVITDKLEKLINQYISFELRNALLREQDYGNQYNLIRYSWIIEKCIVCNYDELDNIFEVNMTFLSGLCSMFGLHEDDGKDVFINYMTNKYSFIETLSVNIDDNFNYF